MNQLGLNRLVLSKARDKVFAMKAKNWSEYSHRFLRRCVIAGNVDASYTLGMVSVNDLIDFQFPLSVTSKKRDLLNDFFFFFF